MFVRFLNFYALSTIIYEFTQDEEDDRNMVVLVRSCDLSYIYNLALITLNWLIMHLHFGELA